MEIQVRKGGLIMDINELSGWGISQQIAQIIENGFSYDEETGEVFFTGDDLDKLEETLEKKMETLAGVYQRTTAEADALKERAKTIEKNAKVLANKADRIKNYIDSLMQLNGKTKMIAGDKTISYRKSTSSEVIDEKALMDYINIDDERSNKYLSYKAPSINKKAISDDIKASKQEDGTYSLNIPGFVLVTKNNINIK